MSEPAKDEDELVAMAGMALCNCSDRCQCDDNISANPPPCASCGSDPDAIRAAIAAIRKAGWTVVPVEPTDEMFDAAERAFPVESFDFYSMCRVEWAAMLAAAPGVKP